MQLFCHNLVPPAPAIPDESAVYAAENESMWVKSITHGLMMLMCHNVATLFGGWLKTEERSSISLSGHASGQIVPAGMHIEREEAQRQVWLSSAGYTCKNEDVLLCFTFASCAYITPHLQHWYSACTVADSVFLLLNPSLMLPLVLFCLKSYLLHSFSSRSTRNWGKPKAPDEHVNPHCSAKVLLGR
jgi:hypothetical protein